MIDHAFAAPVLLAPSGVHVVQAGESAVRGMGSQLQRSPPVPASNARTTPRSRSTLRLSPIEEPTTTVLLTIAGGDVISYSPSSTFPAPGLRSTSPELPKAAHNRPLVASIAINRASSVPMKMRRLHGVPSRASAFSHAETPRETSDSEYRVFKLIFG